MAESRDVDEYCVAGREGGLPGRCQDEDNLPGPFHRAGATRLIKSLQLQRRRRTLIDAPRWMSWAGLAAVSGGLTAIVLTPVFATAYFLAYPGYDALPFWFSAVEPRLDPLLAFSSPSDVYDTFGRIFNLVYVLFLPSVLALHQLHRGSSSRIEKRGFALLLAGLIASFVGVAGDYWANGIGFPIEVLGLLVLAIGSSTYGLALLRSGVLPRWCAWLVGSCGPGAVVSLLLIGHIPSGPTLPFATTWVLVGFMLLLRRGIRPALAEQDAA